MKNRVAQLFNIKHPILLGGMAGVTDAYLSAAVCKAGGLGTIAAANETGASLTAQIRLIRTLTDKPFAVNIPLVIPRAEELITAVIEERVPVVITSAGDPAAYTYSLKRAGCSVVQVVPCVERAKRAEKAGVDAVIAEGFESGGVASPFEVTTLVLVPQVADAVKLPVIAAGGIADARGYAACRILGAEGISVGTAFLASVECERISKEWRRQLLAAADTSTTILTRKQLPIRLLKNSFSERVEKLAAEGISRQELFAFITTPVEAGDGPFPCGQVAGMVRRVQTVREIIDSLVLEVGPIIRAAAESL
ncbi:MAG: enoyl-[acyl-carrier-protein] reductase FabK [Firmicutes bacterium]|nr:enoyl-[acyl-carrier-protein] reductase FabK [Bacillota bacterium]